MNETNCIVLSQQGHVSTIQLNDPILNPIGVAQVEALEQLVPELASDKSVRVIVLRGAGNKNFSVGANLKEGHLAMEVGPKKFVAQRVRLFNAIEALEKPVVAAIQGYCLGGGMELAMSCHFRIADTSAQLSLPEVDLGAAPLWSGASRLLRLVGRAHALDLLLRGRRVEVQEARRIGLLHEVHDRADFEQALEALASELAAKPPLAVAAMIRVINRSQDLPLQQALDVELEQFSALAGTKDNIEGVRALFEKRPPRFIGE